MASEGICLLFVIKSRLSGLFSFHDFRHEQLFPLAV
jgi:hypothetical protein